MTLMDVKSDIAAIVWKIERSADDLVSAGDTLVVLESMKMEIPVEAPCAGRIAEVMVAEGDSISEDDVILRIEAEG